MSTYVLIGGNWLGAWAWRRVATPLREHGHTVYPLSLTGLGERVHLGGPHVDLETHIADAVNLFEYEDLADVILVGHSYAGFVITGVADRAPERLKALVYCDSGPLPDGQSILGMQSQEGQAALRAAVKDGWRWPFPDFARLGQDSSITGLGEEERALMQRKAVDHPFNTWTQPLHLTYAGPVRYERVVIACEDGKRFLPMVQSMLPDARILELDTGHWPMLSKSAELTELLETIR